MRTVLTGMVLCVLGGCSARSGGVAYVPDADDVTPPILVYQVRPRYTPDALTAGIEGSVRMDAVVRADGTVGEVTVTASLDPALGLDAQAVTAIRQWRYAPAMRLGRTVAVRLPIEITFTDGLAFLERGHWP